MGRVSSSFPTDPSIAATSITILPKLNKAIFGQNLYSIGVPLEIIIFMGKGKKKVVLIVSKGHTRTAAKFKEGLSGIKVKKNADTLVFLTKAESLMGKASLRPQMMNTKECSSTARNISKEPLSSRTKTLSIRDSTRKELEMAEENFSTPKTNSFLRETSKMVFQWNLKRLKEQIEN